MTFSSHPSSPTHPRRCTVIGQPVTHSLSPLIHQLGYEFLGITDQFYFDTQELDPTQLEEWIETARSSKQVRGISCTMPHKQKVMALLDHIDPIARGIGAVNTIVNQNGCLTGYNTDWEGALRALWRCIHRQTSTPVPFSDLFLAGKRVAILGAGGASRALIYGTLLKGAQVKVFNRSLERAQTLQQEFKIECANLDALQNVSTFDIIINTTNVGMGTYTDQSLLLEEWINPNQIIFETIYEPQETLTVQRAQKRGANVILGIEMLLEQAYVQFELYTGYQAPHQLIEREVRRRLQLPLAKAWPNPLICGVVTGETLDVFLDQLEHVQDQMSMSELRVDSITELNTATFDHILTTIKTRLTKPAILTCRRLRHHIPSSTDAHSSRVNNMSPTLQQLILQRGIDLGIGWIDVDINAYPDLNLSLKHTRLILSAHYLNHTPTLEILRLTFNKMSTYEPAIFKFAALAHTQGDLHRLTHYLTELLTHNGVTPPQVIMVAMGEHFSLSRALFPLLGSYLTFATLHSGHHFKSAPGQWSSEAYHTLYRAMGITT